MPGPGNYEGKTLLGQGPKYSMYSKRETMIKQTPGPGDYNQPKKEKKGVTIGKKLKSKKIEDLPGPGNYEKGSKIIEGPQFSFYPKHDTKIEQTPGPGDYELESKEQKGITIGQRYQQKMAEELPGPGNYEEKSKISEGPHYSMYQKREAKIEQTPGPGDYYYLKNEKKGVTMGKRFAEKEIEELPGPGRYRHRSKISEGPKFTLGTKRRERAKEHTPGPGYYNTIR